MSTEARRRSPKRAAVIEAATEEFLTHGFEGTSMDRIAETAGVSKRTVYDHFPSKEDLFQAISHEILDRVEQMPAHAYSSEAPLADQLLRIGNTFADTITSPAFMKLSRVVIARFIQAPDLGQRTEKAHNRLRRDMIALFKAGRKDGRLRITNPERAAVQFCGLIKESAFWPQLMAGQKPLSQRERRAVVGTAVEMFLSYYYSGDDSEPRRPLASGAS